jgi:hypothetical protein
MSPPYGPQPPDSEQLRFAVRAKIQSGQLPARAEGRLFGGHGRGEMGAVCETEITPRQVEYEVALDRATFYFHLACHAAWQFVVSSRRDL